MSTPFSLTQMFHIIICFLCAITNCNIQIEFIGRIVLDTLYMAIVKTASCHTIGKINKHNFFCVRPYLFCTCFRENFFGRNMFLKNYLFIVDKNFQWVTFPKIHRSTNFPGNNYTTQFINTPYNTSYLHFFYFPFFLIYQVYRNLHKNASIFFVLFRRITSK